MAEKHRRVSLRLRVKITDEIRKMGRGHVMKGLVSYSKKFGVNLHYYFTFLNLKILNPLYHIYDLQYSTEVSVAKAISYLLHDQANDIILTSSSPFYNTGK